MTAAPLQLERNTVIKIELTQDELTALAGLMDAGIKATGLNSVKAAASILTKLEDAVKAANEPKEIE
jgi:hypothetical protein